MIQSTVHLKAYISWQQAIIWTNAVYCWLDPWNMNAETTTLIEEIRFWMVVSKIAVILSPAEYVKKRSQTISSCRYGRLFVEYILIK